MADPMPFRRPVHWDRLRADEAERIVRERAKDTRNIIIGTHAFDRIPERSILQEDVYRVLRSGYIDAQPERTGKGEWKAVVVRRMAGHREAGVVTIIFRDNDTLFVKTVEWMDTAR